MLPPSPPSRTQPPWGFLLRNALKLPLTAAALSAATLIPSASASAATPAKATVAHTAYVDCDRSWSTTSALRVRTGPSTGYATIGQLGFHNVVDVIDTSWSSSGSWYKVRLLQTSAYGLKMGTVGWASAAYLANISPCRTSINV